VTEVVEHQRRKGEPPRDHREGVVVVARAEDRAARGRDLDLGGGRRIARRFVREREQLEQRLAHPLGAVGIPAPAGKYLPVGTKEHTAADVGRQLVEVIESQGRSESWFGHQSRQNTPVPLSRIAWIATVAICVVAAVLVLLNGYVGYFFVLLAVGASAAVNLR